MMMMTATAIPEDVFLSWLLAQPAGTNLVRAASAEIHRLGDYAGQHPGPQRLLEMFVELRNALERKSTKLQ
ncbi:hypothetical protein DY251_14140 [Mesorhizobium denitrificans]|uniref:Uncharacterized protein n=2 Tax=Phyllobacteriaceae TaxID=69277 RepID=A0A371XCQ1_9HYPH|nr:hypothetical protein DY251_14140 [Mesorhizobium denitrificans]